MKSLTGPKIGKYLETNNIYGITLGFFDILNFTHFMSNSRSNFGPFLPGGPKNEIKAAVKWVNLKISKNAIAIP